LPKIPLDKVVEAVADALKVKPAPSQGGDLSGLISAPVSDAGGLLSEFAHRVAASTQPPPKPKGARRDRGQKALAYYDRQRAAERQHSTALLEEAAKHGGIGKRRLEQLLQERNKVEGNYFAK
jgi:hypothetical protein